MLLSFSSFFSCLFIWQELALTEQMRQQLLPYNVFDTDEGMAHRRRVLGKMNDLVRSWIRQVSLEKVR